MISYRKLDFINQELKNISKICFGTESQIYRGGNDYYAEVEGKIVGYCTSSLKKIKDLDKDAIKPMKKFTKLKDDDMIGWFGQFAILPEYRGKGIVSKFYKLMEQQFAYNLDFIAMSGWKRADNVLIGIESSAKRNNFTPVCELKNHWTEQSKNDKLYSCSCCGDDECVCSAILYVKRV